MKNPLVSLLIPVYNGEEYIEESLKSALSQTYPNIEIIVHDDASTDNTLEILHRHDNDKKLKIIHTKNNHGMIGGWNFIMKRAAGDYIKFLGADDLLHKDCVKELVSAAQNNPSCSIITCKRAFIDPHGKKIKSLSFSNKSGVSNGTEHGHWILTNVRENKIGEPSAVLYKRSDIKKAGYFDDNFIQLVDFEYWLRLLAYGDIYYLNKTLCSFRIHNLSSTSRSIREGLFIDDTFNLIEKYYSSKEYRKLFSLTDSDYSLVKHKKTMDILKNIKDLFVAGNLKQSINYYKKLSKYVKLDYMTKLTLDHILK